MIRERLNSPIPLVGMLLIALMLLFIGAFSTSTAHASFPTNKTSLLTVKPCCLTNHCPSLGSGHHCQFSACRLDQAMTNVALRSPKRALFLIPFNEANTPTLDGIHSPSLPPPIQFS